MLSAVFAAVSLLVQAGGVALAPAPTSAAPPTVSSVVVEGQKSAVLKDSEIVCHKEKVLGSMFPKEICAPRQDVAERRRSDQDETRREQFLRPYRVN